jgi:hypothetical protein
MPQVTDKLSVVEPTPAPAPVAEAPKEAAAVPGEFPRWPIIYTINTNKVQLLPLRRRRKRRPLLLPPPLPLLLPLK